MLVFSVFSARVGLIGPFLSTHSAWVAVVLVKIFKNFTISGRSNIKSRSFPKEEARSVCQLYSNGLEVFFPN